jgi:erythromycin esterase
MAFDNMTTRRILGTRDWTRFEIVLDIPASAIGIAFGFFLSGTGIAWVDDLKMEIVGNDVGVTAGPSTLTPQDDSTQFNDKYDRLAKEGLNLDFEGLPTWPNDVAAIDWIRRNASGLVTDDPAAPLTDLAPLRDLVGSARMVALGEATHGTREFFRMKHRVFRYLVSTLRFTHFAIEASLPEALAVDRYVQTGIGDPDALVKGMYFWTWSTEEVVDLVRWMRSWNASGGTPGVRFVGFDMQFPGVAIDSVVSFTRRMDVADGNLVGSHYSCLASYRNTPTRLSARIAQYLALTQEVKDACRNALLAVEALLTARAGDWGPSAGIESVQLAQRLARVVSQWEAFARVTAPFDTYARDESMAENAAWWLETAPVGSRVMLWAHNGHVSRARRWMGEHLHRRLGGDYLPVALTFSQGTFNAMSPVGSLFAHTIPASEPNSLEALFGATGSSRLLLDTRRISHPGAPIGAIEHTLLRSIGAVFSQTASSTQYLTTVLLPDDFDIVIWFESATASRLLPFPLTGSSSR